MTQPPENSARRNSRCVCDVSWYSSSMMILKRRRSSSPTSAKSVASRAARAICIPKVATFSSLHRARTCSTSGKISNLSRCLSTMPCRSPISPSRLPFCGVCSILLMNASVSSRIACGVDKFESMFDPSSIMRLASVDGAISTSISVTLRAVSQANCHCVAPSIMVTPGSVGSKRP